MQTGFLQNPWYWSLPRDELAIEKHNDVKLPLSRGFWVGFPELKAGMETIKLTGETRRAKYLDLEAVEALAEIVRPPSHDFPLMWHIIFQLPDIATKLGPLGRGFMITPQDSFDAIYAEPCAYWVHELLTLNIALNQLRVLKMPKARLADLKQCLHLLPRAEAFTKETPKFSDRCHYLTEHRDFPNDPSFAWSDYNCFGIWPIAAESRHANSAHIQYIAELFTKTEKRNPAELDTFKDDIDTTDSLHLQFKLRSLIQSELSQLISLKVRENCEIDVVQLKPTLRPLNLLGAIYIVMLDHIEGPSRRVAYCSEPACGKKIRSRQRIHEDVNYCSPTCRKRASRLRKVQQNGN